MDKNRDMRRGGTSRSSPANPQVIKQSGMNNNFEGTVFSKKLKKERMRRLSVVGKVNSSNENGEMGCAGSEFEDEIRNTTSISKRFRFPQKVFHECNTVDHASVPRKLRLRNYSFTFTTMKKRNRESISPPFPDKKETDHGTNGVELPGIKKSRLNVVVISSSEFQIMFYNFPQFAILCLTPELDLQQPEDLDGSPSRPITKDEEEVVETLYALADMFPNNNKNGLDGELGKPKSWPLPEGESSRPACEGSAAPEKEEDSKSLCLSTTSEAEAVNPSFRSFRHGQRPPAPSAIHATVVDIFFTSHHSVHVSTMGLSANIFPSSRIEYLRELSSVGQCLEALSRFCSNTLTTLDVNGCIGIKPTSKTTAPKRKTTTDTQEKHHHIKNYRFFANQPKTACPLDNFKLNHTSYKILYNSLKNQNK
ncbi:hypothetical protein HYC85_008903 [Camellia sinensis]|uniref:Uncharacterized protein n=1 Tax=Camellia sinensis TaxID=4442 RepID=A0A7J7HUG2_CAMSI|nr:hypothetical protein HYC85_008903 [Camellia sinensis]